MVGPPADRVETAFVKLWGETVGAVAWDSRRQLATFEFDRRFLATGLDIAPLTMPLAQARRGTARYSFPALPKVTFLGLPGLLADSLPDKFGNTIIDAWLARHGRSIDDFSPIERLCYTGRRALGALEFEPAVVGPFEGSVPVEVGELVELAQAVVDERRTLDANMRPDGADALLDIIRVGASAGGGRAKAVIALNDATGEVRSGQVDAPAGFTHWILKFDGVVNDVGGGGQGDPIGEPVGYCRVEYAYHLMADAANIEMAPCRLFEENNRAHFITKRFDRIQGNNKVHLQSLCAMSHFDFNDSGSYSYEQAFHTIRRLRLPYYDSEQMFRRLVFNIVARNQDDHTKNIAFLMNRDGVWRLAPAFDVTYAFNPSGIWTSNHQMSVNGKRRGFVLDDLEQSAQEMNIRNYRRIIDEVRAAVSDWPRFARDAGVETVRAAAIGKTHRTLEK